MRKTYVLIASLVVAVLVAAALLFWFLDKGQKAPTASFVLTPDAGEAPLEVKLDGSESSDPDGAIADFAWDFGDGQTAAGQVTTHKFGEPGTFSVKLTVTNKKGTTSSITKSITVTESKAVALGPLFTEIEPADGAVVQGKEAWIRWHASAPAKGKVLWRKAGEADFQTAEALDGDPLLARLTDLKSGEKYEYIVEQSAEGTIQRSNPRTFTAEAGLALEPAAQEQTVQRDYNQPVKVTLHNTSDKKVMVAAKALAQFEDLPAHVVGRGSVDDPVELAPGEKLDLRLAVTATDATRETYDIPIEAGGASTVAHVRVAQPKLQLSLQVVKENPYTLAKTIEIRNDGSSLADLGVRVAPPHHVDVRLDPATGHAYLLAGKSLQIVATPILYLEFQSLKTELECRSGAQIVRFPLEFNTPAGKRLIGVRTNSGETTGGQDWSCPNKPNTCSMVPGPGGNGPASPAKGASGTVDGKDQTRIGAPGGIQTQLAFADEHVNVLRDLDLWLRPDRGRLRPPTSLMRLLNNDQLVALADGDGEPKGGNGQGDDGKKKPAKRGECGTTCLPKDIGDCYSEAHRLQDQLLRALDRVTRYQREGNEDAVQVAVRDIEELKKEYDDLKQKCYDQCGIVLPDSLFDPIPPVPSCFDQANKTLSGLSPDQLEKLGFSRNFNDPDMPPKFQADKILASCDIEMYENEIKVFEALALALELLGLAEGPLTYRAGHVFGGILSGLQVREIQKTIDILKDYMHDPPSPNFGEVIQATMKPVVMPNDASALERLHWDTVVAGRWKVAYVRAWLASFERYQGAQLAKDQAGMIRQATAMVRYSTAALEANQTECLKRYGFQRELLAKLQPKIKAGIRWDEVVTDYRKNAPVDGVPLALREKLVAAEYPEDRIAAFGKQLQEMTPARAELMFGRWRSEIEGMNSASERLLKERRQVFSPPPTGLSFLLHNQRFSRDVLEAAKKGTGLAGAHGHKAPERSGSDLTWRDLRPGLVEALQRRAAFTRAHRGAFAAILEGDATDSSDAAAGWYAGDRVCFAWHQQDQIAFASFDPLGGVVIEPQIIGKGRWPRVTADGKRTAVAWSRDDGFAVRVHDGKQWGDEVALTGREAAIAFAPDGPLFAATSKGLWKLNGKTFERVQDTAYAQPALTMDDKGQPQVAWRRDGRIVFGDRAVDEGERPTLAVAADGTLHLAYLSKGSIYVRSRKGEEWTPATTILAKNAAWPTLARSEEGMRLSYLGAAEPGPDALWLVRLPDKEPVLMPSLAGNVTEAALLVDFTLRDARWKYRPYDLWLSVNDVVVQTFSNTVPEGRYLVKLNPYQVFTSSGRPAPNRIAIHSWHMNAGHYATIGDYRLMVHAAWNEQYAFGASENEVRRSGENPRINHDRPDLTVLANGMELPVDAPKSGPIDFPVTVANLGEASSKPARLVMLDDKKPLAQTNVPALKPGEQWSVTMRLNGRLEQVTFRVEQDQPDFDPTNDALTVHLWTPEEAALVKNPVGSVVASSVSQVGIVNKAGGSVAFTVFAKDGSEVAHGEAGQPGVLLPPGEYTLQTGKTKLPIIIPTPDKLPAKPDFLAPLQTPPWYSNLHVNANNANFVLRAADGRLMRYYNSRSVYDGPFGFGWTFDYGTRLEKTKDGFQVRETDDYLTAYREKDPGKFIGVNAKFPCTLEKDKEQVVRRIEGNGYLTRYGRYVTSEVFDAKGRLVTVRYATGEEHEVRYAGDALKSVVDKSTGKSVYDFETNKDGKVTSLVDSTGRRFRYTYEGKVLGTVTGPDGTETRYRYSSGFNLTELNHPDKTQATLEYDEGKDWLMRLRAAGIDHRFQYGEDSPKHLWTIRTDQEGSLVRWDFDEGADGELVTTIERLDGTISRLLAQMGLADAEISLEKSGAPSDLANQLGWLGKPALDAIQQRLQTAKNVSPERLQRAVAVLEGVRASSPALATKVSALTSDLRNRIAEATKNRRAALVRLDDSGKETARYPLAEGVAPGTLTQLDATHVILGDLDSQRLQVLDLETKQWSESVVAARKAVEERRTELGGGRTWSAAEYLTLLQNGDRPALHVLPKDKEKNTKGYTIYFADFGTSAPELGVMASETLVFAARRPGLPVLSINLATGEARRLADGPVLALTALGDDVWVHYPDRVVQYKAGREQGLVIRLPKDIGRVHGFTPVGDGTVLFSVTEPADRKPGGP